MRRLGVLAGIGLGLALLGGCRPSPGSAVPLAGGIVAPEVLAKASLKYYWQYQVPLQAGETVERMWRLDENVYGLTNRNRLVAVDAASGTYKWDYSVAEAGKKVFQPCHADGVRLAGYGGIKLVLDPPDPDKLKSVDGVVVHTPSYFLLLNRTTGELLRKFQFKFACNSPGTSDGIYLYVGSARGWYYPVRLVDGLTPWTGGTDDMISARPVSYKRMLYVASRDKRLYAVRPYQQKDRRAWVRETDGPLTTHLHVDNRGCFAGSEDFNLYAYDAEDGTLLWTFRTQGPLRQPVQVGVRSLFQWAERDRFYALDLARGEKRWELPDGRFVMGVIEPYVYVLSADRKLRIVHESTGREEMALPMTGLHLFARNAVQPVLYAATRTGRFVCIRPASAGHLTADMLKGAPAKPK